jgi:LacI family transcriptional regulator
MAVTIRDVAEAAGVSLMAVSKVLHGRGSSVRVGEKTAEHIRKIAEDLGYRPNALARSLRLGHTDNIGIIFQGFEHLKQGYYVELLNGILSTSFGAGYSVTICPKLINPSSPEVLSDGRFDGVIWSKMVINSELHHAIETSKLPIVVLHVPPETDLKNVTTLCCDNDMGLDLAIEHLYQLGHRRICFAYETIQHDFIETKARIGSFRKAMAKRDLTCGEEDVLCWNVDAREFDSWWKSKPPHTAFIARGEWFAAQLLERARAMDVSIPADLSLVCFDSTELSRSRQPRLTAIRQPIYEMATKATQILLDQIRSKEKTVQKLVFPCDLDIRESTTKPR